MREPLALGRCRLGLGLEVAGAAAAGQRHFDQRQTGRFAEFGRCRVGPRRGELLVGAVDEAGLVSLAIDEGRLLHLRQQRRHHVRAARRWCRLALLLVRGTQPERCPRAQRPAHGTDLPAIAGAEQEIKTLPAGAERCECLGERRGIGRSKPGAKFQHRFRPAPWRQHRGGLAEEFRTAGLAAPHHGDFLAAREQAFIFIDQCPEARHLSGGLALRQAAVVHHVADEGDGEEGKRPGAERNRHRHGPGQRRRRNPLAQRGCSCEEGQGRRTAKGESQSSPEVVRPHSSPVKLQLANALSPRTSHSIARNAGVWGCPIATLPPQESEPAATPRITRT